MKTTSHNQSSELKNRSEQLSTGSDSRSNSNSRPQIDLALRHANRGLATEQLLELLKVEAPRFYELAEVVGKWVWIQFADKQPPQVTSVLAELGFHWNNKRQVWQHPCGTVPPAESLPTDPREKYGSYFPADAKTA